MYTNLKRFFLLLFLVPVTLSAQESPDTAAPEKETGFLLANASYTSNNSNNVLVNAIRMPAVMANLSYYSRFGVYVSGNFDRYFPPNGKTRDLQLEIGYEKTFKDHFDIGLSYKYRQFLGNPAYQGIDYNHALMLSGTYRLKNLSLIADNSFLAGSSNNYFLDLSLSYDFQFDGLIFKSGLLLISPTITGVFGTTGWMTATMDQTWGNHYHGGNPNELFVPEKSFDYQNLSFLLPVHYSIRNITLGGGWYYSIPSKTLKEQNWTNQTGFMISLGYAIFF